MKDIPIHRHKSEVGSHTWLPMASWKVFREEPLILAIRDPRVPTFHPPLYRRDFYQ